MQTKRLRKTVRPHAPSDRDCRIYERHVLQGATQEAVAADYRISRQRVAQIAGSVEGWLAAHPEHPLAKSIRVRCTRRWESLWAETMAGFERSRENREVTVERTSRAQPMSGLRQPQVTVVQERTVRQHPGDVRFLQVALRVADRQQKLWSREEPTAIEPPNATEGVPSRIGGAAVRFPFLPAGLKCQRIRDSAFGIQGCHSPDICRREKALA
ncbi:MAG TPA: hypothetical protein VJ783_15195 [Pirellulales bacterium]|nr:hypothetical protein [Pirellulales bacterium]